MYSYFENDGQCVFIYRVNNYRYISYNDLGLIYLIHLKQLKEAEDNLKEAAFAEYPFGQNNYGLFSEFYIKNLENAEYMYKRSLKHSFPMAEFNFARLKEKQNEKDKSIKYYIQASDHEDEPLIYRGITRYDKRLEISKTFIICLTNIKLVEFYFTKEEYEESKKYFIKVIEKLKCINKFKIKTKFQQNENDKTYKFIFKNQKNDEITNQYPIDFFSYIKRYILNFPLFNLSNQPNLDLKDFFLKRIFLKLEFFFSKLEFFFPDWKLIFF